MIRAKDELVQSVSLYRPQPTWLHGYLFPFAVIYALWICVFTFWFDWSQDIEFGLILLSVIAAVQILTCLFCQWSIHVKCLLTCKLVSKNNILDTFNWYKF